MIVGKREKWQHAGFDKCDMQAAFKEIVSALLKGWYANQIAIDNESLTIPEMKNKRFKDLTLAFSLTQYIGKSSTNAQIGDFIVSELMTAVDQMKRFNIEEVQHNQQTMTENLRKMIKINNDTKSENFCIKSAKLEQFFNKIASI